MRGRSCLLAYLLKKAANFVQHFLEFSHANHTCSGVVLHHQYMERGPHRFFFRKNVGVVKSHSSLLKSHIFRAERGAAVRRRAAPEKIFGFWLAIALVTRKFSADFSHGTAASSCIEIGQCTQTHHAHTLLEAPVPLPMPPWPSKACQITKEVD